MAMGMAMADLASSTRAASFDEMGRPTLRCACVGNDGRIETALMEVERKRCAEGARDGLASHHVHNGPITCLPELERLIRRVVAVCARKRRVQRGMWRARECKRRHDEIVCEIGQAAPCTEREAGVEADRRTPYACGDE